MLKRDDAFKSVVKFETSIVDNGKNKSNVGTGFFVSPSPQRLYLVTASHLAKNFNDSTVVYFAGKNSIIKQLLTAITSNNSVIHHTSADVSVIEINIPIYNSKSCTSYSSSIRKGV